MVCLRFVELERRQDIRRECRKSAHKVRGSPQGDVKSTRNRRPLVMLYYEQHEDRKAAFVRERFFKTPEGGLVKQQLIDPYRRVAAGL